MAAVLALASCRDVLVEPPLPEGAQPLQFIPEVYAEWFRMTRECAAVSGEFDSLEWYVMPAAVAFIYEGRVLVGLTIGKRIVIAEHWVQEGPLVRHEMLHALLKQKGHPRDQFVGKCGGIVTCETACLSETTPAPVDPNAVVVSSAAMQIGIRLDPARPDYNHDLGAFRFIVSVTNPFSYPVIVQLAPSGDAGPPASFRWRYQTVGGGLVLFHDSRASAPDVTRFAPGETKTMVYDFFLNGSFMVEPFQSGTYEFSGAFGDKWTGPSLMVVP